MLDFKLLGKKLTAAGLWEKPLHQFEKGEILELAMAIHSAQLKQNKQCGTCWYQSWKGLRPCCLHPDHPVSISVFMWGAADCPNWSDWLEKESKSHELNRKPRVDQEHVK